jgi:hypothetical protein
MSTAELTAFLTVSTSACKRYTMSITSHFTDKTAKKNIQRQTF